MDFNFLAAANGITSKYLNQLPANSMSVDSLVPNSDIKGKFGEEFDQAYDSMQATKLPALLI